LISSITNGGIERRFTMRCGRHHDHRYVTNLERPTRCSAATLPASGSPLLEDAGNLQVGHRPVGAVLQSQHLPAGMVVPHRADECHHAAPLRTDYLVRHVRTSSGVS
jgi:hypothetical protein